MVQNVHMNKNGDIKAWVNVWVNEQGLPMSRFYIWLTKWKSAINSNPTIKAILLHIIKSKRFHVFLSEKTNAGLWQVYYNTKLLTFSQLPDGSPLAQPHYFTGLGFPSSYLDSFTEIDNKVQLE